MKKIMPILILVFLPTLIFSQEKDSLITVLGNVYNARNFTPVEFAHVINTGRYNATITDTMGNFRIKLRKGDTLLFTSIGYESKKWVYDGKWQAAVFKSIPLEERIYQIERVEVRPWGTYREFKNKFMSLDIENPRDKVHPLLWKDIPRRPDTIIPPEPSILNPISLLYSILSEEGKSKRKLRELQKEDRKDDKINQKYNKEIIGELTGLEGEELERFMKFCNFTDEYLLNTKQYNILKRVKDKYQVYSDSLKTQN